MHSGCFDLFYATVIDRAESQNNLILDTDKGFYQCPFCKKLGNVLLPHTIRDTEEEEEEPREGMKESGSGCDSGRVVRAASELGEQEEEGHEDRELEWVRWMSLWVDVESGGSERGGGGVFEQQSSRQEEKVSVPIQARQWSDLSASSGASPSPSPAAITSSGSGSENSSSGSLIGQASASLKRIHDSLLASPSSSVHPPQQEQDQEQHQSQSQRPRQERRVDKEEEEEEDGAIEMSIEDVSRTLGGGGDSVDSDLLQEQEEEQGDTAPRRRSSTSSA